MDSWELQEDLTRRFGGAFLPTRPDQVVGIARNLGTGLLPLNGLRHPPEGQTSGWYLWAGRELSAAPDFFEPVHAGHLTETCPEVIAYLGLGPGWRFLLAGAHVDVWYDAKLLEV